MAENADKKSTAKKPTAKKPTAKKPTAKKPTAKKATAKKATAKKATAKKGTAKKGTAKKSTAKNVPAKKSAAKNPTAKSTAKKATAKNPAKNAPTRKSTAKPSDATRSRAWRRAMERAKKVSRDDKRLRDLVDKAGDKSDQEKLGKLGRLIGDVKTLIRLVRAYAKNEYRDISIDNLILIVAGLIYFVSPVDLIPDFIGPLGFADDAVVLGFVLGMVGEEVRRFEEWEAAAD